MENRLPITRTKILIPRRRADLLTRQRLLDQMSGFIDQKLVIVAAPAGYGKTSLLVDFLQQNPQIPAAWLSLDPLDQDPLRFISHLVASIQFIFPEFGRSSLNALQNANPDSLDLDNLTTVIVNDLSEHIFEHFLVVLDDYHLIEENKPVTHFINQFIQLSDENCQVIIASRTLLNLPDMPLLVARGQVGGLSFELLSFSAEEIVQLWDHNFGLDIKLQDAEILARETEGWITGLLLTQQADGMLSDRMIRARVSGVNLYDYLAQQVLERQTAEIQRFLLRTSLLEDFDVTLCEQVITPVLEEAEDWPQLVEELFRLNLFLQPVESEDRVWLRYHHLFRDFLVDTMRRTRPQEARAIELNMAAWWISISEWDRAYEIYRRFEMTSALVDLVETAGPSLIARGRLNLLSSWINALPESERRTHPNLLSLEGTLLSIRGNAEEGLRLLDQSIRLFDPQSEKHNLARALVRRSTARFQLGRFVESGIDAGQALTLLNDEPDSLEQAEAYNSLGMTAYRQGELQEALRMLRRSRDLFIALQDGESAAKVGMHLGMVAKALGQYADAEMAYNQALAFYRDSSNLLWQASLLNNLGVLQHQIGDYTHAAQSFERCIALSQEGGITQVEAYSLASIGDLYRDVGALQEAREAFRQARPVALRQSDRFLLFYLDLQESVLSFQEKQPERAERLLDLASQAADLSGSPYQRNLVRLEKGVIAYHAGNFEQAENELKEASIAFERAGHKAELTRARLYQAALSWASGEKQACESAILYVAQQIDQAGSQNLLGSISRDLLPFLQVYASDKESDARVRQLYQYAVSWQHRLPNLRKQLRRQAQSVPIGPPHIAAITLGQIQVRINNHIVTNAKWIGQSSRDLFLLLLAQPNGVTKIAAEDMIWPEGSFENAGMRFKNAIYRVRKAIGKNTILFENNLYSFNRALDYEEDAETFERLVDSARRNPNIESRVRNYEAALNLYKGDYLPDLSTSWVLERRTRLRKRYLEALVELGSIQLTRHQDGVALSLAQQAIQVDAVYEPAYQLAIQVHGGQGDHTGVERVWQECRNQIKEELDREPSSTTVSLYESFNIKKH